ncbi:MAG TPA: hypothetical protein VFQ61_27820 [Polyangiaceae bacterium]|nr:hypothetical protein [Polyangiaceae bacterium]
MSIKQCILGICVGWSGLALAGCSSGGALEGASADGGDGDTAATEEALGSVSCSTATADKTLDGSADPTHVSPSTYNTCYRGYVVDINNLSVSYTGVKSASSGYDAHISVDWKGPVPTTKSACESAWGSAIFYKKVGGSWVDQSGVLQAYGEWQDRGDLVSFCSPPSITTLDVLTLEAGASYRVAATMRTTYGGSTLRALGVTTRKKVSF